MTDKDKKDVLESKKPIKKSDTANTRSNPTSDQKTDRKYPPRGSSDNNGSTKVKGFERKGSDNSHKPRSQSNSQFNSHYDKNADEEVGFSVNNNLGVKLKEKLGSSLGDISPKAKPKNGDAEVADVGISKNKVKKVSTDDRTYATGKRKTSIARVWIKKGSGKFIVNNKDPKSYFGRDMYCYAMEKPFETTKTSGEFDVWCTVQGGGHTGQSDAIKLGISRALDKYSSSYRVLLKADKLLTRDPRIVERKKYGKHGARKSTQFSKR